MREATVSRGAAELDSGGEPLGRARAMGGGRKRLADLDPGLRPALLALIEPEERGDPMSPLRWTTKSTRVLAAQLALQGHRAGPDTVAALLREEGFSLQGNAKTIEGKQSPDRDAQFRYLNEEITRHQDAGEPVVSVDTKKKEQVGEFTNPGRQWRPAGDPVRVRDHDFIDPKLGKVAPYGIYDLAANTGWVNVGTDHDTAMFAAESLRRWWNSDTDGGAVRYPNATRLLITADAGGSNSHRSRVWKSELARFATETGLVITVCHFPPGTSKWNKIEHRLFSHITSNWRGRPLTSHEVIVNSIAATTTRTGLSVHAELDHSLYPLGVKASDEQMAMLPITFHDWHGNWNYTLDPHQIQPPHNNPKTSQPPRRDSRAWTHPALTGMPVEDFEELADALITPYQAYREAELHIRRGGPSWRKPAGGHPPALSLPEMLLITILRARYRMPRRVLAELFGVVQGPIAKAEHHIKPLLEQRKHHITPTQTTIKTLTELTTHAAAHGITLTPGTKSAC